LSARKPLRESEAACEDQHMKVVINGEDRSFDSPITLAGLVHMLGMKMDRVAVELNRDIVPRHQWERTQLADGDRLEIVHFVGGGLL
jgi:thiamine biosynthesis protein ThiS